MKNGNAPQHKVWKQCLLLHTSTTVDSTHTFPRRDCLCVIARCMVSQQNLICAKILGIFMLTTPSQGSSVLP